MLDSQFIMRKTIVKKHRPNVVLKFESEITYIIVKLLISFNNMSKAFIC